MNLSLKFKKACIRPLQSGILFGLLLAVSANSAEEQSPAKFRFGSYGEVLYQHYDYGTDRYSHTDGAPSDSRATIDIPRLNFALDYHFSPSLLLGIEAEFEHGGTGGAMELEYEEAGEYEAEVEKGGEVELEELRIEKTFFPALRIAVGHMQIPVGAVNAHHLPIEFFGTARSESGSAILPATWHETGISIAGDWKMLEWEFLVVNGLDANGFSSSAWIKGGKQGAFEQSRMTDPAGVGRLEATFPIATWKLRLGTSGYIGKSTGNTAKPENMDHIDGLVGIASADLELKGKPAIVRADFLQGWLTDSYEISRINKNISRNLQVERTPVASSALAWSVEAGIDVLSFFNAKQRLLPFVRYEYYNTMEETEGGILADDRFERTVTTLGANWYFMPNVVLKADYAMRSLGDGKYNDENTLGIALAYTGWLL